MSQVVYCEINPNKKYRTLEVMYNSAQTQSQDTKEWVAKHSFWQEIEFSKPNMIKLEEKEPSSPIEEILTVSFDGFEVNTKKMDVGRVYHLTYDDSEYELVKNSKDELVISEVG